MERALRTLPPKLGSMYQEILDDIVRDDETNKAIALYTMALIMVDCYAYDARHLAKLISVAVDSASLCLEERDILTACKHLVLVSERNTFAASHFSAHEFLENVGKASLRWDNDINAFTIGRTEPTDRYRQVRWDCIVAQICLKWLEHTSNPSRMSLS